MNKWLVMACLVWSGVAWAATEPSASEAFFGTERAAAVLQNPSGVTAGLAVADKTLQPSLEEFYDLRHSDFFTGSTVALYTFSSKQIPIASLRAGYGAATKLVGEVKLDVAGLIRRYVISRVPSSVKHVLTAGVLDDAWGLMGRYGHAALFVGYDLQHHDDTDKMGGILYGVSLGGTF